MTPLRLVSGISLCYDVAIGVALLAAGGLLAQAFGVPPPQPPIFVEITGVLMIAIGLGYLLPYRQPDVYRGYLWVMGPLLKGGGALTFVIDHYVNAAPAMFLLFAVSDGLLALATLWALLSTRVGRGVDRAIS